MNATEVLPNPTAVPPQCTVGPDGEWIHDTDSISYVETVADYYGRPAVEAAGYVACVRVLPDGQVLIVRAPAAAA